MGDIPEFTTRPELAGTFGMVASTHWLASAAGMAILERGGNAFDAGVAAGFTLQGVETHLNGRGDRRGLYGPRPRPRPWQRPARRHRARRVRWLAPAAARVRHAAAARRA